MEPGDRIGRYVLVRLLGSGGMGEVWEAVLEGPAGFRKPVALKFLHEHGGPSGRSLVHEARLGGLLQHPHLVEVYALEEIDGRFVCAMELVRGGSLARYVPLPPRAVVEAGLQVCTGLIHAHEQVGLVHLDLKPDNLLLGDEGVKVADLGIARALGSTGERGVFGSPAYAAPEVLAQQALDARADIYSLGLVLIHLALGQLLKHPTAVDWLAPVTSRCVVDDPNARFRSMRELADALARLDVDGPGLDAVLDRPGLRAPVSRTPTAEQSSATFRLDDLADLGPRTNLTAEPDAFFGRTRELAELLPRLDRAGLVTLKGTGGLGKTRLARRAARAWHEQTGLPAWFVDLTAARDRTELVRAVADTLELAVQAGGDVPEAEILGHALSGRGPLCLVLDNFEQLVDEAPVVGGWLAAAPELRLLVTSREPLRLAGEQRVDLGPLPEADAVALLVDRAAARGRDLTDDPDLPELVRQLDGLPLALELAAGRLGMLTPRQVLDRLDQRFRLLRGSDRTASARQLTLRGTLDWSWNLLDPVQRSALAQASVFAGGFTAEAAEAVWDLPAEHWVLDVLHDLVDRSLVHVRPDGRFDLYESTRAYAAEHLDDPAATELRHARWYARYGAHLAIRALMADGVIAHPEHRAELPNLLLASRRAVARGDGSAALGAARGAWAVLELTGPYSAAWEMVEPLSHAAFDDPGEASDACFLRSDVAHATGRTEDAAESAAHALDHAPDARRSARALRQLGRAAFEQGRSDEATAILTRALEQLPAAAGGVDRALTLGNLAVVDKQLDRFDLARDRYEEALAIYTGLHARRLRAAAQVSLASLDRDADAPGRARERLHDALNLARKTGDRRVESVSLGNLAVIALDFSELEQAEALFLQTIALRRELGDRRGQGILLGNLGQVYADMDRDDEAEAAMEEALAIQREVGSATWLGIAEGYLGQQVMDHDLPRAVALLEAATERLAGRHEQMRSAFLCSLAEANARAHRFAAAQRALDALFAIVEGSSRLRGTAHAWAGLARVRAHEGRFEEAEEAIGRGRRIADEIGMGGRSRVVNDLDRAARVLAAARAG